MQKTMKVEQKSKRRMNKAPNLQGNLIPEKSKMFEIMFVCNDEDQSVEVVESAIIDFNKIIEHLGEGNSVFIAPKIQGNYKPAKKERKTQSSYINHV